MDEQLKTKLAAAIGPIVQGIRTTAFGVKKRGKAPFKVDKTITAHDLTHHVNGGPAIIAYLMRPGSDVTALGALDLDDHTKVMPWADKVAIAFQIVDALARQGVKGVTVRSGGGAGLHIWIVFRRDQNARSVRALLRGVLAEIGYTDGTGGLDRKQIEVYPKQDSIPLGAYGGGIALPFSFDSVLIDPLTGDPLSKDESAAVVWDVTEIDVPFVEAAPERVHAPREDVDLSTVVSALNAIPNDESVNYDKWLSIVSAVHSADPGDLGREAAEAWSMSSTRHKKGHFDQRWEGFKAAGDLNKGATVGSIFYHARANGWKDPEAVAAVEALDALVIEPDIGIPTTTPAVATSDLPFLIRDNKGNAKPLLSNVTAALANPYTNGGIQFGYDSFKDEIVIAERPGQWRPIKDVDAVNLRVHFETMMDPIVGISREIMRDAIMTAAEANSFDSAQMWLGALVWDGKPRVRTFFSTYFGVTDSEFSRACSAYFWTAHAGRVLSPGIQADMAVILTGEQGRRKSSGLRAICPSPEYFVEINLAANPADLARLLRGKLVAELAELSGLRSREIEHTKAFIARTFEDWVPKFKEHAFKYARRNVFTGTTNEDEFLEDATGNRRFLPLRVEREVDVEAIIRDVLQLWAEAAVMFADDLALGGHGIEWQAAERLAREVHDEFTVTDPWTEDVQRFLAERENPDLPFTGTDCIKGAVAIPSGQINHGHKKRIAAILKRLGYTDGRRYIDGVRSRAWAKGRDSGTDTGQT